TIFPCLNHSSDGLGSPEYFPPLKEKPSPADSSASMRIRQTLHLCRWLYKRSEELSSWKSAAWRIEEELERHGIRCCENGGAKRHSSEVRTMVTK
ncbi:hypothetical protein LINPERPRIM_LOCUS40623, partial [Linum perenne]